MLVNLSELFASLCETIDPNNSNPHYVYLQHALYTVYLLQAVITPSVQLFVTNIW